MFIREQRESGKLTKEGLSLSSNFNTILVFVNNIIHSQVPSLSLSLSYTNSLQKDNRPINLLYMKYHYIYFFGAGVEPPPDD